MGYLFYFCVDEMHLVTELLAFDVLAIEVAFELGHKDHVVRFDHSLQA